MFIFWLGKSTDKSEEARSSSHDRSGKSWMGKKKKRLLSVLPVSKQRNATCSILMRNEVNIFAEIISTECNKRSSAWLLFSSLCGVLRPGHSSLTQQGTQKRAYKYAIICHLLSIYWFRRITILTFSILKIEFIPSTTIRIWCAKFLFEMSRKTILVLINIACNVSLTSNMYNVL